ncbi:MAG: DUF3560 domain-containing protein [Methanobrevibacter sp.]|nr:DUF3560 domain-containing protein [Methanobrevibacter sp.]
MKVKAINNGIRLENEKGSLEITIVNEKWITVHPNGEENKGRHLLLEDGETPADAIKRQWGVDVTKKKGGEEKVEQKEPEKEEVKEETKIDEKEEPKSEEKKSIDDLSSYEVGRTKGGFLAATKETVKYKSGDLSAEVEDFGSDDDAKYRVVLYDGKKIRKINVYSTKSGMEKAVKEHLAGYETKTLEKTNLDEKRETYERIKKEYEDNDRKRWNAKDDKEYRDAWDKAEVAKKELTRARREYAESIMANFEEVDENPYEERQQARKEKYEELSEKAQERSDALGKSASDKFGAIPFGQPIHGQADRNYREKAWAQIGRSIDEQQKAEHYAEKAKSVGKAGISSDDANAIAKLAKKYNYGAIDSAEKRRIIDRVIEIDKRNRMLKESEKSGEKQDYSDLGFDVERNADINRLQLKFSGIPSGEIRTKLKSYGFRWSPRESAWQRQLGSNAEYSFKRLVEELRKKPE